MEECERERATRDNSLADFWMQGPCSNSANATKGAGVGVGTALSHFSCVAPDILRHLMEVLHGKKDGQA